MAQIDLAGIGRPHFAEVVHEHFPFCSVGQFTLSAAQLDLGYTWRDWNQLDTLLLSNWTSVTPVVFGYRLTYLCRPTEA